MTTKSRVKKAEQRTGGTDHSPIDIIWSDDDPIFYEGREISKDEFNQLVKKKKIILIEWPEDDKER